MNRKLLLLFLLLSLNNVFAFSQDTLNDNSFSKKNSFVFSLNYALNGLYDQSSMLYRNEYIRNFNSYFSLGAGVGFFSYATSYEAIMSKPATFYEVSSIINIDIIPYLNIINLKKHFFKIGFGYSLLRLRLLIPDYAIIRYDSQGNPVGTSEHKLINEYKNSSLLHIEYGYRISTNIATSLSGRYYSIDTGLSYIGLSLLYSF